MKKMRKAISLLVVLALCVTVLAACGSEPITSPENLTYNQNDGTFSFDALNGAKTYIVGVSKIINDTTGEALADINQSSTITLADGSTVYLWSEQTGSVAGLADDDGDGTVTGTVIYREFSSSANTVGAVMDPKDLPVGHYVLQAVAAATDELPNPESAIFEFVVGGTLQTPSGFTASINEEGYMQISAPSAYYLNCLTVTGMPEMMVFEISDGSAVVETIELADFSYTNTVIGPDKSFTFNHNTVTGTTKLDSTKEYTVTVTAKGDGDQIQDASAKAYMASATPAVEFATKYGHTGSGTADALSVSLSLGVDATGNNIYELTATVSNLVVMRESGTYTATADVQDVDGEMKYAEGTVLTFATTASDASAPVLDGVSLTAAVATTENWGQTSTTYYFTGNAVLDGISFEFEQGSSGGSGGPGGMPGGPGGMPGGPGGDMGGGMPGGDQGGMPGGDQGTDIPSMEDTNQGNENSDQGGMPGESGDQGGMPSEGGENPPAGGEDAPPADGQNPPDTTEG